MKDFSRKLDLIDIDMTDNGLCMDKMIRKKDKLDLFNKIRNVKLTLNINFLEV